MNYSATTYRATSGVKPITVKQAALALGVTPRAVIYKIEKGELNGKQLPNPYGVNEWRIYPTKEIAEKLRLKDDQTETNFEPGAIDAIEAETVTAEDAQTDPAEADSWVQSERAKLHALVQEMMPAMMKPLQETMIQPLLETIRAQERELQEQSRQLKLLPDLKRQADEERAAAEQKQKELESQTFELEALKKQVESLQEQKDADTKALQEQMAALTLKQSKPERSWWQKFLLGASDDAPSK